MTTAEPGPEHSAKHELCKWLTNNDFRVYWEERNPWDYPTFSVEPHAATGGRKPDLLIVSGERCAVVEMKPGEHKAGVYDAAMQLQGYWFNHTLHNVSILADGEELTPVAYLTATENSRNGHLFPIHTETQLDADVFSDGRLRAIERGWLPATEFSMTEQHIRNLWRFADRSYENTDSITGFPAIGSLLSTRLDGEIDAEPAMLIKHVQTGREDWQTELGGFS